MKINGKPIFAYVLMLFVLLAFVLVGCDSTRRAAVKEKNRKHSTRIWEQNDQGVIYFNTCINGKSFIATQSWHQYTQLAGPTGECK